MICEYKTCPDQRFSSTGHPPRVFFTPSPRNGSLPVILETPLPPLNSNLKSPSPPVSIGERVHTMITFTAYKICTIKIDPPSISVKCLILEILMLKACCA